MEKLLLTPEEAGSLIGIGRTKVYELIRLGRIESVRIGTCRRVRPDAVERFVRGLPPDAGGATLSIASAEALGEL